MHNVLIVGGGLAGLVAGLHLAEAGLRPLLIEAAPRLGGRVAGGETVRLEQGGRSWAFTAEHGIHGVWGQYHNLRAVLGRVGAPALIPARREDWLHGEGGRVRRAEAGSMVRRSPFPAPFHYIGLLLRPGFLAMLTPRDLIGLPRVAGHLFLALAYDPLREETPIGERTLEGLFEGWPPRLRAFIAALMRSGLAAHPEDVPLAGFLAFLRFYTLLRRDAWAFDYFPADSGAALIDPIAAAIVRHGGEIRTETAAVALERQGDGWLVRAAGPGGEQASHCADQLVLAVDGPAARRLLEASPATAAEAAALRWPRGLATGVARLWFSRAPAGGAESGICSGDLTVDNFFWLHRFQADAAAWHAATGGSLVEAHIYGPAEVLALPDAALVARAAADIQRAYPELRGALIEQTFQRNPPAHTRFGVGAGPQHLGVESPWPGLSCCGDWLRYPHPALFLERATVTGIAAAGRAAAALGRAPFPLLPASPPEPPARAVERALRWVRRRVARRRQPRPGS